MILLLIAALASPSPDAISLDDALARAGSAPATRAAQAQAEAADRGVDAVRRNALLPVIGVGAEYRRVHEPLSITTPIGPFQIEPERVLAAGVDVTQPLFKPQALLYDTPAAKQQARAARLNADAVRQQRAADVGDAWLGIKRIDAQRAATEAFIASLAERDRVITALVEAGRGLEADRLKISLALDQARQDLRALDAQRTVATRRLGQLLGKDTPVDVAGDPSLATAKAASGVRPDLSALDARIAATNTRRDAVWGGLLPSLDLFGSARYADTDQVQDRTWLEGGVRLTWVAFAGNTRSAQADALEAEARALSMQREDARRGIDVEIAAARAALETANGQLEVARRGIEQAKTSLDLEQRRYDGQAATMNDVLAAEATLRERRTREAVAALDVIGAQIALRRAEGRL